MLIPPRSYEEEWLDEGVGSDAEVAANLRDLRRVNRWLGGRRALVRAIAAAGNGATRLSVLDVGTGSADIPQALHEWCARRRIAPLVVGLDYSERNLRLSLHSLGVSPKVALLRADAFRLPFADRSFDFVIASQFLHHFDEADVVRLLVEFRRVARRAVVVSDLMRHRIPYYLLRLSGRFLLESRLARNDGPLSILRGFTVDEMRHHAEAAGLTGARVTRRFPYRLMLIAPCAAQGVSVKDQGVRAAGEFEI